MLGDELHEVTPQISQLNKERAAVLVIDILGDPTASPIKEALQPVVKNAASICDAARLANVPVIFVNDAHIPDLDRELEIWGDHCLAGTPEAQPAPQLGCGEGDYTIEKRRYSGFFQTGLRLLLDELGVDDLICVGMDTNICVQHTVADAYFNNFRIFIAEDATLTFLIGDQRAGIEYMRKCYAATIASSSDIVAQLRA